MTTSTNAASVAADFNETALIEKAVLRVGMKSLMNHGAGSLVYSEGVNGVTQEHIVAFAREIALHCVVALSASPGARTGLREELQQQCSAWGTYWRASDSHGVVLTQAQAVELLENALGVEVEVKATGWISVDERLPAWAARDDTPCFINGREVPPTLTSETVLVALKGGGVRTDKLTTIEGKSDGWWHTYGERVIAWQPTPIPPAPKE